MVKLADIIAQVEADKGNVSEVCRHFGKGRDWFYDLAAKHPQLKAALDASRYKMLDKARQNIYGAIDNGDIDVSKWALARLDPEYRDKHDSTQTGEHTVRVEVVRVDDD